MEKLVTKLDFENEVLKTLQKLGMKLEKTIFEREKAICITSMRGNRRLTKQEEELKELFFNDNEILLKNTNASGRKENFHCYTVIKGEKNDMIIYDFLLIGEMAERDFPTFFTFFSTSGTSYSYRIVVDKNFKIQDKYSGFRLIQFNNIDGWLTQSHNILF